MSLTSHALRAMKRLIPASVAHAHCDIPCGIYDPHLAQVAAHTVVRMDMLIQNLQQPDASSSAEERAAYVSKLSRYITAKEEHAEVAKRELRILWGDYFKPEHLQQHPNLHTLFWDAMKAGSAARQDTSMSSAQALLKATQDIAEIFWKTKGASPVRQPSRQTSGGETVYPS